MLRDGSVWGRDNTGKWDSAIGSDSLNFREFHCDSFYCNALYFIIIIKIIQMIHMNTYFFILCWHGENRKMFIRRCNKSNRFLCFKFSSWQWQWIYHFFKSKRQVYKCICGGKNTLGCSCKQTQKTCLIIIQISAKEKILISI